MPGWVEDLLKEMFYGPFYQLAKVVWDWCIGLSTGVISQDPQHFSPATWKFVTDTLYPWAWYRLRHGDIVLIPPGVSHRPLLAEKMADPYRRCVVWFSQEYVESVRPMWPELLKNQRFGVLRTANTRWEGMAKLFEAGCGEAARGAPGWQAVVCATTLELLVNIARALEDVDRPTPPAEVPDLFDRLNLFIEEHLAQDVTLERAAREFFVSKSTIDQLFRKKLGISFYRYLTQSRLIAAKERILEGEALGRICTDVGFADYSTFYRAFRREYGVAPSDFRDFNRL